MIRLPYGFMVNQDDVIITNEKEAVIVKSVFQNYLSGDSIGKIAAKLSETGISPPFGNQTWSYATINKILSEYRYISSVISEEQFLITQIEKEKPHDTVRRMY